MVLDETRSQPEPCGPAVSVEQVAVPGTTASCCRAFALQYIRLLTNLGEPSHQVQALGSAQQSLQLSGQAT